MEVILLERVEKLGQMGEVVKVKNGYARNYLLPRRKALRATKENLGRFDNQRAQLEALNLERRAEAQAMAEKIAGLTVVVLRQAGDTGQLYGSVSSGDIAQAVTAAGFTIERRQVRLDGKFKSLGLHSVRVGLHPEVAVEVTVNIARSEEEARVQAAGGTIGLADDEDEDEEVPFAAEAFPEAGESSPAPSEEPDQTS